MKKIYSILTFLLIFFFQLFIAQNTDQRYKEFQFKNREAQVIMNSYQDNAFKLIEKYRNYMSDEDYNNLRKHENIMWRSIMEQKKYYHNNIVFYESSKNNFDKYYSSIAESIKRALQRFTESEY